MNEHRNKYCPRSAAACCRRTHRDKLRYPAVTFFSLWLCWTFSKTINSTEADYLQHDSLRRKKHNWSPAFGHLSEGFFTKMASETPKGVSSRLLTMKFMQRAVASASSSPQQSDDSSQNSKKRKLRHSATTAAEERVSALIDQASIKAALEDQEAKRQAALAQHTATGAHWVLNTKLDKLNAGKTSEPSLNVVYVGYGDIDSSDESGGEDAPQIGRTSTRKPKVVENQACSSPPSQPRV